VVLTCRGVLATAGSDNAYLLGGHGLLAGLAELLDGLLVETQILLAADQDLGHIRAEMVYLRAPLSTEWR
jgi:hypothetical protein